MEVKAWTYEEFPDFTEEVEGVQVLPTTGDELGVRYIPNVEYANVDGTSLTLQILRPITRNVPMPVLPCVVFVQGSAWFKQDCYANVPSVAKLAARGYVAAIVEYRHSGIAPFPAQAIDARNAVRFLRQNAEKFGIDPEKIIMSGDSSGGHTAMFAGIRHNDDTAENLFPGISAEVKGIVNYYGSVSIMLPDSNPTTINHHQPDSPEGQEMGGVDLRDRPDLCRALSVECNIDETTEVAPTLIFHGTKDMIVNCWQSVNLYRRMKEVGKDVQLYLVKGANHGGAEFWTDQILDIVDAFIKECLAK